MNKWICIIWLDVFFGVGVPGAAGVPVTAVIVVDGWCVIGACFLSLTGPLVLQERKMAVEKQESRTWTVITRRPETLRLDQRTGMDQVSQPIT